MHGGRSAVWALPSPHLPHPRGPPPSDKACGTSSTGLAGSLARPFSKEAHFLPLWAELDELSSLP